MDSPGPGAQSARVRGLLCVALWAAYRRSKEAAYEAVIAESRELLQSVLNGAILVPGTQKLRAGSRLRT